jgi:hypothetical protein
MTPTTQLLALLLVRGLPVSAATIQAQVTQPTPPDTAIMDLQPRKEPPIEKGQVAVVRGMTAAKGLRFRLTSLSVLQPVIVSVLAKSPSADLRLSLFKPGREAPSLSGSTLGQGLATLSTRTQGGVDIVIDGPSGTPFALIVWVSDELAPRLASVVVRPEQYRNWAARHPTSSGPVAPVPAQASAPAGEESRRSWPWLVLAAFLAGGTLVVVTVLVVGRRHA